MQVVCNAASAGTLNSTLELITAEGRTQQLTVTAVAMNPAIALSATTVDIGVCYIGVPIQRELVMSNLTMLPTAFSWQGFGERDSGGQMEIAVEPKQGILAPGETASTFAHCRSLWYNHCCTGCTAICFCHSCFIVCSIVVVCWPLKEL